MNLLLGQIDLPALTGDPKAWLTIISGVLVTMIVGRFIQAFRNGAGLIDAAKAVLFGTNIPKPPSDKPPTIPPVVGLLLIGLLAGLLFVGTGCKSTSTKIVGVPVVTDTNGLVTVGTVKIAPEAVGAAVKSAATIGFKALLKAHPEAKSYLTAAAGVIDLAVMNQNYDPDVLTAALKTAIGGDATTYQAVSEVVDIYRIFYGQILANKITNVSPYLTSGLEGISAAITDLTH